MSFSRDKTTSPQADNIQNLDDINDLLMIEVGVTKKWKNWTIEG